MNSPAKKNEAYQPTRHEQIANCCTHAVRAPGYSASVENVAHCFNKLQYTLMYFCLMPHQLKIAQLNLDPFSGGMHSSLTSETIWYRQSKIINWGAIQPKVFTPSDNRLEVPSSLLLFYSV